MQWCYISPRYGQDVLTMFNKLADRSVCLTHLLGWIRRV